MKITVYNPQKGRMETIDVAFTEDNTTWFNDYRMPRDIRMITDYKGGILIADFDYTYLFWIYGVSRKDIDHNAQKAKRLRRRYE
jgi:hypothetical protein